MVSKKQILVTALFMFVFYGWCIAEDVWEEETGRRSDIRKSFEQNSPAENAPGRHHGGPGMAEPENIRQKMKDTHDDYIRWLEKSDPNKAQDFKKLRISDPQMYMRRVGTEMRKYSDIIRAEKFDPNFAKVLKREMQLKAQRDELLREIRAASGKDREELKKELQNVVSEHFDILLEKKQMRYNRLKERLAELEKDLQRDEKKLEEWRTDKQTLVENRLEMLLESGDKFEWD